MLKKMKAAFVECPRAHIVAVLGVVLAAMMMLCASGCGGLFGPDEEKSKELLLKTRNDLLSETPLAGHVKAVAAHDFSLVKESGNKYVGVATVEFKTVKGTPASEKIQFKLTGTFDGTNLLLESEAYNLEEAEKRLNALYLKSQE